MNGLALSLLAETEAAHAVACHLSSATEEAREVFEDACQCVGSLLPLYQAYEHLRAAESMRRLRLSSCASHLAEGVRCGAVCGRIGAVNMHLYTLAHQAPYLAAARAALYLVCDDLPELATLRDAYEARRSAEAEADARVDTALRRAVVVLCQPQPIH